MLIEKKLHQNQKKKVLGKILVGKKNDISKKNLPPPPPAGPRHRLPPRLPAARPPPPDPAPCAVRWGMGGAMHRRRAGGVGGEVGFFFIFQIFFTDQKFYPKLFSFDFDAIFFL